MFEKKHIFTKMLSVACTVALLFQCTPIFASADDNAKASTDSVPAEVTTEENTYTKPTIVGEDTSLRKANVKQFRCSDGSYIAAIYDQPVHYLKGGKYEDIDNTLVSADDSDDGYYVNKNNAIHVKMPKKADANKPVSISDGANSLSWSIPVDSETSAQVEDTEQDALSTSEDVTADEDDKEVGAILNDTKLKDDQTKSKITYNDADTNVGYQYQLDSTTLKESIILNQRPDSDATYSFDINSGSLTAKKLDNGEVTFADNKGNTVFTIQSPYMFDSNNNTSDAIEVTLTPIGGGYRYTIKPDSDWLSSDSCTYPVTIDPTVGSVIYDALINDASVISGSPDNNYGYSRTLDVGTYVGSTTSQEYTYMHLPRITEVNSSSQIVSSGIQLYNTGYNTGSSPYNDSNNQINLYRVTSAWDESLITWNNQPSVDDSTVIDYNVSNGGEDDFDITSLVQDWYTNGNDYGFMLKSNTQYSSTNVAVYNSSDGQYPSPVAYIQYRNTNGLENQWTYTSMNAGRSNVASVNNLNGNFVVSAPIASADGNREPVSLSCVFNTSGQKSTYACMGYGWKLNYDMMIYEVTDTNLSSNYPYYFCDSDGTIHYFCNTTDANGNKQIKDEDGLGYTLTVNTSSLNYYTITDKNGGEMYFNSLGQLTSICDTNSNQITINHSGGADNYRISSVQDGAGRTYSIQYTNSEITSITDPSSRVIHFGYTGYYLTSITYSDGKGTQYQYDYTQDTSKDTTYGGVLQKITAIDNTYTKIDYFDPTFYKTDNGDSLANRRRVEMMSACAQDETVQSSYTFDYEYNYTRITDQKAQRVDYEFNNYGQTINVVDESTSTGQYYAFGKPGSNDGTDNKLLSSSKTESSVVNYLANAGISSSLDGWTTYCSKSNQSYSIAYSGGGHPSYGCVKINQTGTNPGVVWTNQDISDLAAGYYTISAYVSTTGQTLTGNGVLIFVETVNSSGVIQKTASSDYVVSTGETEWKRINTTVYVADGEKLRVFAGYDSGTVGTVYLDSFQVEKGESVNSYNMIENNEFTSETNYWTGSGGLYYDTTLQKYCIQINGDTSTKKNCYQSFSSYFHAGDIFTFGGWARGNSVPTSVAKNSGKTPAFRIRACFYQSGNSIGGSTINFNTNTDYWQYLCGQVKCPMDCNELRIYFDYDYNASSMEFTDAQLYQEQFGETYTYDKDGNLTSSVDLSNAQANFAYKNNQLSKLLNPTGDRYLYTYDDTTKNINYASSTNGQRYTATYDQYGNPKSTKTNVDKFATSLKDGQVYYVRNAYSGNALDNGSGASGHAVYNYSWHPDVAAQQWKITATAEQDVYIISATHNSALVLDVTGGTSTDNTPMELYSYLGSNAQFYKIQSNGDGTFRILTKCSNYTKCVDGEPGDSTDTSNDSHVYQYTYSDGDEGQEWYFTPYNNSLDSSGYFSSSATYTSNGNYLSTTTDGRGKTTNYNYDTTKGVLNTTTDPEGNTTSYSYDPDTDKMLSVSSGTESASYHYTNDRLDTITHKDTITQNQVVYGIEYDQYGRTHIVKVKNGSAYYTLSTNDYINNKLSTITYGNGHYVSYAYDNSGRLINTKYDNDSSKSVGLSYNAQSNLGLKKDFISGLRTRYTYDLSGRLIDTRSTVGCDTDNGALNLDTSLKYEDGTNRLLSKIWSFLSGGSKKSINTTYSYGSVASGTMPTAVYSLSLDGYKRIDYTYDDLGRKYQRVIYTGDTPDTTTYTYKAGANTNQTTALLNSIQNSNDSKTTTYSYDYYDNGNIHIAYENGSVAVYYFYDSLNQLIREDNIMQNKTIAYSYDNGNLTSRKEYDFTQESLSGRTPNVTVSYGYGDTTWKDLLTSYNGQTITYDTIGNPLQYRDGMAMTWQNGRQLKGISKSGLNISYAYNGDGIRTSKTVNSVKTSFIVDGSMIVSQQGTAGSSTYSMNYLYDENGKVYGFYYNDIPYFYEFNGQGDVVAIISDHHGEVVANYSYDTWGKLLSVTDASGNAITDPSDVANLNVFRYRGYCYDNETGLYYLQSRYYDPNTGRFINEDALAGSNNDIVSYNLFVYCSNNPVNHNDASGYGYQVIVAQLNDYGDGTYDYGIEVLNTDEEIGYGLGCKGYTFYVKATKNDVYILDGEYDDPEHPSDSEYVSTYAALYLDGGSYWLASGIYEVYKQAYGKTLPGRTIGGIDQELKDHFFMYINNFETVHTVTPNVCPFNFSSLNNLSEGIWETQNAAMLIGAACEPPPIDVIALYVGETYV